MLIWHLEKTCAQMACWARSDRGGIVHKTDRIDVKATVYTAAMTLLFASVLLMPKMALATDGFDAPGNTEGGVDFEAPSESQPAPKPETKPEAKPEITPEPKP